MPQVDEFVSVSEAKNKLLDLIRRMKHKQEVVAITRDGVPSAVLLSMDILHGQVQFIPWRSGAPQYFRATIGQDSIQRNRMLLSKNGSTRSFKRSAAITGVLRSYSLANPTLL
ncbi:MAG: type II toxin-antitoxin system Phd/YefM family antitoxin [Nitrospira sp.]|nr:type II toxin-antitoxin system Phd/YefM family antitoxin [Nitrospira sp.]